jgi:hypothetical protein
MTGSVHLLYQHPYFYHRNISAEYCICQSALKYSWYGKGNVVPVLLLIKHRTMETYREWRYSSNIFDLSIRWTWMVSFMPRPLYSWGKSLQYPLNSRLSRPQSQSEHCEEEKTLLTPVRNWTPAVQPIACCYANKGILTQNLSGTST